MNVYAIFLSIDGEVNLFGQGNLSVFLRLAGCNLRCAYCDTIQAQGERSGKEYSIENVVREISGFPRIGKITITGGEPLIQQQSVQELCRILKIQRKRINISIETNGSILIEPWKYYGASFVADWKLPSSGMSMNMEADNFRYLGHDDVIKFVISDRLDFDEALYTIKRLIPAGCRARYAFSPMLTDDRGQDKERINRLAEWMLKNPVPEAILNIQLHKVFDFNELK